ncbi:D-inositol-3-phosphate glycosyltransferase [Alphaproteobacteria bacterium SO-S41]|nr:D-inositol-3-phosphate glycosyltransferase [Alphaproteobacteria bacterium SO-S41]
MRILHGVFTRSLFGSERYAADLARLQCQFGHEVHIAVDPRSRLPQLLPEAVRVHALPWFARRWRLKALMKRLQPDICHAHLSAACKALGALTQRPPAVATLHVGYKPRQHARLDGLIALTDSAAARIADFKGRVTRIWNWSPRLPDPGADPRGTVRRELGIAGDAFVIGFVGRLHPSKNPQLLVEAYRAAGLKNAALVLAGDGPERADVEKRAAGDPTIHVLGLRTDAARLYQAFDLFVLPSRFEQVPLVLMEAMASGLPIAASAIESIAEFLPVPPAHLFPSEDAQALAAVLNAEAARAQRREAYDMTPFNPETQAAKIMTFYDTVRAAAR